MCFFFFKQKTAYEMRISDWSSDVCSSDLPRHLRPRPRQAVAVGERGESAQDRRAVDPARRALQGRAVGWRLRPGQRTELELCDAGQGSWLRRDRKQGDLRSEERRVGKECGSTSRSRRATDN